MNNRPPISSSPSSSIGSYRKRRQRRNPNIIYIIAGVLILGGVIILIVWLTASKPLNALFATNTPTPTMTFTPTNTSTPTNTPTITPTFTATPTNTFSAPFTYTVQDGDTLTSIIEKYKLGKNGIALIQSLNPYGGVSDTGYPIGIDPVTLNILPGQVITLPYPGMPLPTETAIPVNLQSGSKISYTVKQGDMLGGIAALYNSSEEAIIKENNITDPSKIFAGQVLIIPVNIVTATATRHPTSTPVTPGPGTELPTVTPTSIN